MAYFGKTFVVDSQENFDKFVESFGAHVPDQAKQAIINEKSTLKLEKNGDEYVMTTNDRVTKFKSGVEFDEEIKGNKAKTTITVDGNVVTQVEKFDSGVNFTVKREFSDNQVVAIVSSTNYSGPQVKRIYKA